MITSSSSSTRAAALLLAAAALADGRVLLHNHAEKIKLEAGEQHLAVANHQKKNLGRTMAEHAADPDPYAGTQGKLGQTPASKGMCCSFYWLWSLVAFASLTIIALIVANWLNYKKREEQGREANDELQARGKKVHVEANDPFGSKGKKAQEEMSKKQ